eukprot:g6545.t1
MIRNELRHAIRQAKSDNLVQAFKQKFDKLNPLYNAVVETSPSISVLSSSSSPEHRNHSSPLNGVPFLVKEVINVENFATTLCDPSLKTSFASSIFTKLKSKDEEAGLVTMLKEKGGVVVGKTNVPLKGLDVQCENPVYGLTLNPNDRSKTCGGSSGGSATAVKLGMVPLALGSDLAGSLRLPAAFCGVTSMRCSYGRLPVSGHVPPAPPSADAEAESSLQIGPLCQDIGSLQTFLSIVGGNDSEVDDPGSNPPILKPSDVSISLSTQLGGFPGDAKVSSFLENEFKINLKNSGVCSIHDVNKVASNNINLKEINKAHIAFSRRFFVEMNGRSSAKVLDKTILFRDELRQIVDDIIGDNNAWILPTCPAGLAFDLNPTKGRITIEQENGDMKATPYWPAVLSYVLPFTISGHPIVTMPVGKIGNLPLGVQVIGKRNGDDDLLHVCRVIEESVL